VICQFRVPFDQYINPTLDLIKPPEGGDLLIKYKFLDTFSSLNQNITRMLQNQHKK